MQQITEQEYRQALQVEGELEHFIERRHDKRVSEDGRDRAEEEAWKESSRKHAAKQREQTIEAEYRRLTEDFGRAQGQAIADARRQLYKGSGTEHYAQMLERASGTPDEKLPELAKLAAQSGLADLEQAVAVVADQRKPGGTSELFRDWVSKDPARQAAHERLKGTPDAQQFYGRTLGVKPPKARAEDLEPTAADRQRAAEEAAQKDAPRREFFGGTPQPRRQVGRHIA